VILYLLVIALLFIIILALAEIFQWFKQKQKKEKGAAASRPYSKINYKNIELSYLLRLNGGGIIFAYEFVHIVSKKIGKVDHIFEYCAGPGFIGFSLLANNLCDRLTLADTNPVAVEAIKETIKNNNLQDKVTVYQSDCLDAIPENEQWDLVVGNPPWSLSSKEKKDIRVYDTKGHVHRKF